METSIIEKTEKARLKLILLQSIGFGFWIIGGIIAHLPFSKLVINISSTFSAIFGLLFIYATIKSMFLRQEIKNNKELSDALGNEMYQSFAYKAQSKGFFAISTGVILIYFLDDYIHLSVKMYCMILLLIAVITVNVYWLIQNKQ